MPNVIQRRNTAQRGPAKLSTILCGLVLAAPLSGQHSGAGARPQVEVRTELGTVVLELYNETPAHRDNFLKLVREGAYDSLLFHRVVPGFTVEGGDPASKRAQPGQPLGEAPSDRTLPAEIVPGLVHKKGALGAMRQDEEVNPGRHSDASRFYIVVGRPLEPGDLERATERAARYGRAVAYTEAHRRTYARVGGAPHLDGGYTIFGEVAEGMAVIDAIAALPRDARDRPLTDIRLFMRVLE